MLTSFGFSGDAPSASLGAEELPERASDWLARHGCAGPPRTDLRLERSVGSERSELTDAGLRAAVRCIRLRLYETEEAEWAIESGHLDAPWGGVESLSKLRHHPEAARLGALISSILQKDLLIAENTHALCRQAVSDKQRSGQRERIGTATADLQDVMTEELAALDACAEGFAAAREFIAERGQELFGSG